MLSLFLGVLLLNIGFVAGMWLRGQMEQNRLSHVLRYDKESGMWQEIKEGTRVNSNEVVIIGFALYPPPKE
jgi:hypothetical protein